LSDQCEATYQDLRCILPAGHIGRHHDRANISTLAWDDPAPRTYTEQELAQATADGLEQAAQIAESGKIDQELAKAIRALIPADIAAKAKERDAKIRREAYDEGVNHGIGEASKTWDAEAARIRQEAYLRCADSIYKLASYKKGAHIIDEFRKWAKEPPSGGKADGGA
jgi:hypothetical protein